MQLYGLLMIKPGHHNGSDGINPTEGDSYVPRLADELRERGGYTAVRVVWAQRPF